jgi:hypothetical protein
MKLEVAAALVIARSHHLCEGCGRFSLLDAHHRLARGMGGVSRAAAERANDPRNFLALCRHPCHESTEAAATWRECELKGWRFRHGLDADPLETPALIHTVNGFGWWFLTEAGGYRWADLPYDYRLTWRVGPNDDTQGTPEDL